MRGKQAFLTARILAESLLAPRMVTVRKVEGSRKVEGDGIDGARMRNGEVVEESGINE